VVFSEAFSRFGHQILEDQVVFVLGKLQFRDGTPNVLVDRLLPIERVDELALGLRVEIHADSLDRNTGAAADDPAGSALPPVERKLRQLRDLFHETVGNGGSEVAVLFEIHEKGKVVSIDCNGTRLRLGAQLTEQIESILGEPDCCRLSGPPKLTPVRERETTEVIVPEPAAALLDDLDQDEAHAA
jgi:hypothetical protein